MLSKGRQTSISREELISMVDECSLAEYYLGIHKLPILIHSPLRVDNHPSFSLSTRDGKTVYYVDFATSESGTLLDLLGKIWHLDYNQVIDRIYNDAIKPSNKIKVDLLKANTNTHNTNISQVTLECKVRDWKDYDIEYWESYGISLEWLKYADVYPISHKIIIKDGKRMVFPADKLAYTYVHYKDNKVQLKIYSPYNTKGFKWTSNLDRSVWSLWDKIPEKGDNLIIASSLKDCLNIFSNLGIPAICLQGEGYIPKPHVIKQLQDRYKNIIIFYDNDYLSPVNNGRKDALVLHRQYGFPIIEIPAYFEAKDPSDLYKKYGKESYTNIMKFILNKIIWKKSGK